MISATTNNVPRTVSTTLPAKRVAFRSPPALPLSPDSPSSYTSSPIASRLSAGTDSSFSISEQSSVFGEAYPRNTFLPDGSADYEQANFRKIRHDIDPTSITTPRSRAEAQTDSIQPVFGASVGNNYDRSHRGFGETSQPAGPSTGQISKPAIDVDSFTRLLLTGDRGLAPTKSATHINTINGIGASDTSSSADTASISRQSIFEPLPPIASETPRSSNELEPEEANQARDAFINDDRVQYRTKPAPPPPPKPRHGKAAPRLENSRPPTGPLYTPNNEWQPVDSMRHPTQPHTSPLEAFPALDSDASATTLSNRSTPVGEPQQTVTKRPPTPPLSRRRSSNRHSARPDLFGTTSSANASSHDRRLSSGSFSSVIGINAVPPPPPARRSGNSSVTKLSTVPDNNDRDPNVYAEPDQAGYATRPPLPPSRHSSSFNRLSLSSAAASPTPPPPPPPRRRSGSNRVSIDTSTNFPLAVVSTDTSAASSPTISRTTSGQSQANTILADLARLQEEVETAMMRQ